MTVPNGMQYTMDYCDTTYKTDKTLYCHDDTEYWNKKYSTETSYLNELFLRCVIFNRCNSFFFRSYECVPNTNIFVDSPEIHGIVQISPIHGRETSVLLKISPCFIKIHILFSFVLFPSVTEGAKNKSLFAWDVDIPNATKQQKK